MTTMEVSARLGAQQFQFLAQKTEEKTVEARTKKMIL